MAVGISGGTTLSRASGLPASMSVAYTVCGWAKRTTDTNNYAVVVTLRNAANSTYNSLGFDADGTTLLGSSSAGNVSDNFPTQPTQDQWFFFAMVGSASGAGGLTFYFSPEGSGTFTSFSLANANWNPDVLEFGDWAGDGPLTGHLQYLRCWTAALTQNQLEAEKAATLSVRSTNRHFDWRLNDNADTSDQSGNSRTPTVTGTLSNQTGPSIGTSAATLSAPTPSGTLETQTTATIGCTTDQNTGTLYVVVDSAANMSGITDAQIIAGTNANDASPVFDGSAAISTTSPSVGASGLTANTAYAYAIVQVNDNGESNVVSGTFTTAEEAAQEVDGDGNFSVAISTAQAGTGQAAARKLRLTEANELELRSETGALITASGVNFEWYDKFGNTTGEPDVTGSFDVVNGEAVVPLFGSVLDEGQPGTLILYHPSLNTVNGLYRLLVE